MQRLAFSAGLLQTLAKPYKQKRADRYASLQGLPALSIAACMRVMLVKDMYAARCADVPHPDLHEHSPTQGQHRMCYRSQLKVYLRALQMQS